MSVSLNILLYGVALKCMKREFGASPSGSDSSVVTCLGDVSEWNSWRKLPEILYIKKYYCSTIM